MKKIKLSQRLTSIFLCFVMLLSYLPVSAAAAKGSPDPAAVSGIVTDPGTADTWEHMMGTDFDGNRYAGRVWVDKSVYKNGDVAKLNSKNEAGSSFTVSLEDDEAFQVIFSALGSTMTTTESFTSSGPMDVVLVFDTSTSMDDKDRNGVTRLERTIDAANDLIDDLLQLGDIRIAIVTYNADSETVVPLAFYNNGLDLVVTEYEYNNSSDSGVIYAYDSDNKLLGKDDGYTRGTNLQSGIDRGFNILANASDVTGRIPVAIVLTDGQANRASEEGFYEISSHSDKDGTGASGKNLYLSTLLNAAYNKTKIEEHYKSDATVYTVGVDISGDVTARLLVNPGDPAIGFNSANSSGTVRDAYSDFLSWADGDDLPKNNWNFGYSGGWTFDHKYPTQNGAITDEKIASNINYVDTYYDVSNDNIGESFDLIIRELSSGAFNPISSTTTVEGGTGVEHTPLIFVDFIGQYMEIKEIQAVSLFGSSYNVIKNADGTYSVDAATGTNPTTNEAWNTAEDILISVIPQTDGTQKLEIRINQEILPILMEQVSSQTVGDETTATIVETRHSPLRVFYTVGVDSDILLPNGQIDITAVSGYEYLDVANGQVSFYSNSFGVKNAPDANGTVLNGDAHVGFKPSAENRYYYHQANQGIFSQITDKNGDEVTISPNDEYGIVWDDSKYNLHWMTLDDYKNATDSQTVYTYVTYYRPTISTTDAATAAEEITYLVYGDWGYLKESVSFFDNNVGKYINHTDTGYTLSDTGIAIPADDVDRVINAYTAANRSADIYAVLGVGSLRTSRLHNMMVEKSLNLTDSSVNRYSPEYTHDDSSDHYGNDVVVWLGNNGRLTMDLDTGIVLTKNVTRPMGSADDLYALTVTVPAGVTADPVVFDVNGNELDANLVSYSGNVLTVKVRAGETVYVSGIPAGTVCTVGESIPAGADYYVSAQTATVTVPTVSQVLAGSAQYAPASVTNAPNEYGNLYITKEITSQHTVPEAVLNTAFDIVVNVGTNLAGKTFSVQLSDNGTVTTSEKTVNSGGEIKLSIKARDTVEIFNLPAGTAVTVTESAPGSHFEVSYRTRNHSGEAADSDNAVVIPQNANATAIVFNRYIPGSTTVDLDIAGTKNFISEGNNHPAGTFAFKVQKFENGAWVDVDGKTASVSYEANEEGVKTFAINDVLNGITFGQIGSFAYRVLEVKGSVANVTYDRTLHSFNVHVTDNNGQLVAKAFDANQKEITDGSYEVLFTNTYHTAPVSLDIRKLIENKSGDETVSLEGFEFKAVATDSNWTPLTGTDAKSFSVYSDASGVARFSNTFRAAGTYYFVLSEVEDAAKAARGWTYSKAVYHVTVEVVSNNNDLTATLTVIKTGSANTDESVSMDATNASTAAVTFENVYDPQDAVVDLDGLVSKVLTGKKLEAGEFTFRVYKNDDRTAPVSVGTNNLNGNVSFVNFEKELVLSEVGKYEFDVVEVIPTDAVFDASIGKFVLNGMGYDPVIFDLVVEVVNDPVNGKLVASYYFEDSVSNHVTFYNVYSVAPTDYVIQGTKTLHGRSTRAGEFFFELYEGDQLIDTVSNRADGTFTFKKLEYTEAGVHTYTVKEKDGTVPGVTYTGVNHPVTVVVTVTDDGGVLRASADVKNADIKFENTYAASSAKVNFSGTKTFEGGALKDGDFSFNLYQTTSSFELDGATLLQTVENVGSAFTFATRTLSTAGTYYFVIAEDLSAPSEKVVYDRALHCYAVSVTDVGSGQLLAVLTDVDAGTVSTASATVSAKADFVNATFEEVVKKEVQLAGNTSTSVDGKKVNPGDVLTYYITYTNYNGQDVVVNVMDTIPNYTSYVEGSASHGGTYAGTHLDWVLNVKKGESVTVSFDVKVDQPEAIMTNTAVIRDGYNVYKTNEVVNHTVDKAVKKDVFAATDLETSIDGKKVYEGDELVYTITYSNVTGEVIDLEIVDTVPHNTTYVANSADRGGVYNNGKLTWNVQDVPAWATVTVSFKVTVNTKIGATTIVNEATASDGRNNLVTNKVTNYTVSDDAKKDVYFANDVTASIDGKKVKHGDELIYSITYKNTDSAIASVTVTDILPVFVTLVEGSVTDGGIYENGAITWKLEVAAGETKTVSFKVKVTGVGGKTVENTAVIMEGKNIYTSNSVTNTIEMPNSVIPNTGDGSNLALWFTLLFVSGTALFVIPLVARKRRTAK